MVFHTKNPHFVLFPLMAQGHIIPMMDIARLLAQRGIIITIFTTPKNASRFNSVLSRAVSSGLQIRIVQLHFPSKEAGLPEGCENVDMVTSEDMYKIFYAINMLQKQAEELFEALTPKPSCIISDFCIHWTTQVAQRYHIPRISFHGFSCFALHCLHQINSSKVCENITSESEYFTIPGIPDQIHKAQRGNQASINEHHCFKWLDLHQPKSVLYVCFGSLCNLIPSQLVELALALEDTKRPFVWVIREGSKFQELEKWIMEEGFEERTKGRGLIIRGWAPQVLILSHPAIGGFLTHCGWNSTLEGISAGVPLITWPLFGDQFLNEKLITQVLKIGVSVGVEIPMKWGEEEKVGLQVKKEDIKKTICMVMDDDNEESRERRERAGKLSEMAKRAVEKDGSSHLDMTLLIQDIMQQSCNGEEDMKLTPKDS
uniref:Glycosyltransferase n=1 Tax=Cajanus cajan TaxID=3821 RepID=A0A151TVF6_CAJCA|nr:Cytokinin-O-glucosyltransferase 1 [Cajanus cajan]